MSDAKWSPASKGFVVVCGTMPAIATLYDLRGKPIFNFGEAHRNVSLENNALTSQSSLV